MFIYRQIYPRDNPKELNVINFWWVKEVNIWKDYGVSGLTINRYL